MEKSNSKILREKIGIPRDPSHPIAAIAIAIPRGPPRNTAPPAAPPLPGAGRQAPASGQGRRAAAAGHRRSHRPRGARRNGRLRKRCPSVGKTLIWDHLNMLWFSYDSQCWKCRGYPIWDQWGNWHSGFAAWSCLNELAVVRPWVISQHIWASRGYKLLFWSRLNHRPPFARMTTIFFNDRYPMVHARSPAILPPKNQWSTSRRDWSSSNFKTRPTSTVPTSSVFQWPNQVPPIWFLSSAQNL